ncbi:hypothetical protein F4677DRAFT_442834 [Hypoxylon crocopeplum]|nr:hypothetical protein F4677DRAFT_442834 [Hypoxylon crocopeplum]
MLGYRRKHGSRSHVHSSRRRHQVPRGSGVRTIPENEATDSTEYNDCASLSYNTLYIDNISPTIAQYDNAMTATSTVVAGSHSHRVSYSNTAWNKPSHSNAGTSSAAVQEGIDAWEQSNDSRSYAPDTPSSILSGSETTTPFQIASIDLNHVPHELNWSYPTPASGYQTMTFTPDDDASYTQTTDCRQVDETANCELSASLSSDFKVWSDGSNTPVVDDPSEQEPLAGCGRHRTGSGDSNYPPSLRRSSTENHQGSPVDLSGEYTHAHGDVGRYPGENPTYFHDDDPRGYSLEVYVNSNEDSWTSINANTIGDEIDPALRDSNFRDYNQVDDDEDA